MEFRTPALLDEEEVAQVLSKAQSLRTWAADVEDYALNKAIQENIIPPGYKLGTSITHRTITDKALAATVLLEHGFKEQDILEPSKLKPITALEKLGPKNHISNILSSLIQRPEGSPKLVRVKETAKDDFA